MRIPPLQGQPGCGGDVIGRMRVSEVMKSFYDTTRINVSIGNPIYLNQVLEKWFPVRKGFDFFSQQNHVSTYTLSGWEPGYVLERCRSFLESIGYGDIVSPSRGYEFYSQGNTQSVVSTVYTLRTRASQEGKQLRVVSVAPTYFELEGICRLLGVPYESFPNVSYIGSKDSDEYLLFYCCSPNNPDGHIYNQVTDIPPSADAVYYDLSYGSPQYTNIHPVPPLDAILSRKLDCVVFGFSFSKIATASLRVSYSKVFSSTIPVESFRNGINSTTLGFSLGTMNTLANVLDVLQQHLSSYLKTTTRILQRNKEKVAHAIRLFFGSSNVVIAPYDTGGFLWLYVPGKNPTTILEGLGIEVKSGVFFFTSSSPEHESYARVNTLQSEAIIDAFCQRLLSFSLS